MKVNIWGREINDCMDCCYTTTVNGIELCGYAGVFSDMFRLNSRVFSKTQNYYIQEIPMKCPFAQPITKEVLEQYFRNKECYQCIEVKEDEGCIYLDLYEYEDIRDEFTRVCYAPIQDTDYWGISVYYYTYYKGEEKKYQKHEQIKVTNKVHLIFILNSII